MCFGFNTLWFKRRKCGFNGHNSRQTLTQELSEPKPKQQAESKVLGRINRNSTKGFKVEETCKCVWWVVSVDLEKEVCIITATIVGRRLRTTCQNDDAEQKETFEVEIWQVLC